MCGHSQSRIGRSMALLMLRKSHDKLPGGQVPRVPYYTPLQQRPSPPVLSKRNCEVQDGAASNFVLAATWTGLERQFSESHSPSVCQERQTHRHIRAFARTRPQTSPSPLPEERQNTRGGPCDEAYSVPCRSKCGACQTKGGASPSLLFDLAALGELLLASL